MKAKHKISMLDYTKIIIAKVAFDRRLLLKEFRKSQAWLADRERSELYRWMKQHGYLPDSLTTAH
ncbi:MAG: hypothetical protein HRU69_06010 [Flammeovirgaceae bacterium]|nr:MAG: hypothetical protein HRU69_06010 [Flammeovirgaceae bacterium]